MYQIAEDCDDVYWNRNGMRAAESHNRAPTAPDVLPCPMEVELQVLHIQFAEMQGVRP